MTTLKALHGKLYAGNPHVRFDGGEVASAATPRRGSLLYKLVKIFRKTMGVIVAVAVSAVLPSTAVADLDDGLLWIFRAKDGIANGETDMSNFRDQLTISAASTKTLTFQSAVGYSPYLTNMTVKAGIENATWENQPCLCLDQPTNTIDGVFHSYEQRAKIPYYMLAESTEGVSFFARVKWDGPSRKRNGSWDSVIQFFQNGNDWRGKGWGVQLRQYGGIAGNAWIGVVVGSTEVFASSGNVVSDESQWTQGKFLGDFCDIYPSWGWVDIGVTLRSVSEEDKTYVTIFKCQSGTHSVSIGRTFVDRLLQAPSANDGLSYIFGGTWGDHTSADVSANFRGAVREVRLWNRCLSEEEMKAVFAGQQQGWSIGAKNDSADEFSDAECVGAFNPRTMSWSKMRKTLTSANPSVSITTTLPADRRYLPRTLHIKPILSAEAAGAKLDVSLNGANIGNVRLRDGDNWFFIKERVFSDLVGNDGVATFTLTRSGNMAGTVMFDFLELTGSFQIGNRDNVNASASYSEFGAWNLSRDLYSTVEDTKIYTGGLAPQKTLDVRFPLSKAVADHYKFRFSTHLFWQTEEQLPLSFTLNDVAILPTEESSTPTRTFYFDIEPGVLQECNKFSITAGVSTRTDSGDKNYAIDYYRLDVINTDKDKEGFILLLR